MIPTSALAQAAGNLLAANAATLAPAADANKLFLIQADFTPDQGLEIGDLTAADFDGSTPIAGVVGTQPTAIDPATGDNVIDIKPPAGGYRWETTGTTNLPQTIYGFGLMDNAGAALLATEKFDEPIVLTDTNQRVDVLTPNLRMAYDALT